MKKCILIGGAISVFILVILVVWCVLYPEKSDPKSLYYQAWKLGVPTIGVDTAYDAMIGDRNRLDIVRGKTIQQLEGRFGRIRKNGDLLPDQQLCLSRLDYLKGKDVAFLGDSYWLVVFENNQVSNLILCSKG